MTNGKIWRYLSYAVGEIFLVVLGILIALYISNWNENRKQQKENTILLGKLYQEIELNIERANYLNRGLDPERLDGYEKRIVVTDSILQMLNKGITSKTYLIY